MPDTFEVLVPLLNPNEPEAKVVALQVEQGQRVAVGDVLCTLETTKSTADVIAERVGYVVGIRAMVGGLLRAGERLCWLAETVDWQPPESARPEPSKKVSLPEGLRITDPALTLAEQANLDLNTLPVGPLVTQAMVEQAMSGKRVLDYDLPDGPFDPMAMVIYGGGGHGKSLIDLVRVLEGFELVGVIDDGIDAGNEIMDLPVLGGGEALIVLAERGLRLAANAVGGVGDIRSRVHVFERILEAGFTCPSLAHPTATIEPGADLADGVQVFPNAYVGSDTEVGFGAIVNTGAVVSHDCRVKAYANIAPGALLAGGVTIGEKVLIGMGATINLNVEVGGGARVGNGAVVKQDVPRGGIVRAGGVWPPSTTEKT
jgi:acetyltransferase EpsM